MSDGRFVSESDRVVVLAPDVLHVEHERPAKVAHETTIVQSEDRAGVSPTAFLALLLCFLLAIGLIYVMATSGNETPASDDLNLSIDVASPSLPTVTVPAVQANPSPVVVERQVIETQKLEAPTPEADATILPGEPLEPVEPTQTE